MSRTLTADVTHLIAPSVLSSGLNLGSSLTTSVITQQSTSSTVKEGGHNNNTRASSKKYRVAVRLGIPIMKKEWIDTCAEYARKCSGQVEGWEKVDVLVSNIFINRALGH